MQQTTTLASIRKNVRSRLKEPTQRFWNDADLNLWINDGVRDFSAAVKWYSKEFRYAVVANQVDYQFPGDMYKLELIRSQDQYRIRDINASTWSQYTLLRSNQQTNIPFFSFPYPHDRFFKLHPAFSASSWTTTVAAPIAVGDTTISLTSVGAQNNAIGGGFQNKGVCLIDNEQIRYYAVNSTTNQLLQCTRGWGDTTPVTHAQNANASAGDLSIYYRGMPPVLVLDTDVSLLPDLYIEAITLFTEGVAWATRGETFLAQAQRATQRYEALKAQAVDERQAEDMDKSQGVQDEEFGMGYYGDI